jgi:hypothetical protein
MKEGFRGEGDGNDSAAGGDDVCIAAAVQVDGVRESASSIPPQLAHTLFNEGILPRSIAGITRVSVGHDGVGDKRRNAALGRPLERVARESIIMFHDRFLPFND